MNEHKSEGIGGLLVEEGYQLVSSAEDADLVIFNTCMVREKPEDKVYSEAGKIRILQEKNPDLLLGIGGCMAQAVGQKIFERSPTVDFVFGSSNLTDIPRLIEEARAKRENGYLHAEPVMALQKIPDRIEDLPFVRESTHHAKVTITEGCSNFCAFCIVPYTTGLLRSRFPGEILNEVSQLADQKFKEVQLLGQNVDSYGNDLDDPDINFANLLRAISHINIPRIRFMSSHPQDITSDVIQVMSEENNVCEHIHMAVQAGSDRILEEMRRGYSKDEFLQLVDDLKSRIPGINITTDIIVGFPTETENDFMETVELIEKARFGGAYIFKYSPRPGTISVYKYKDDVPMEEKQARLVHLLEVQKKIANEENSSKAGEIVEVLVEGEARSGPGRYYGKSRDHRTVIFSDDEDQSGKLVHVAVEEGSMAGLFGSVVAS
jgi:tRNA-2-methylthio-N6-dimethylallyladenosine synthase